MGNTSNHYKEHHKWSKIKDAILKDYLSGYFPKLMAKVRPIVYVDGFAGEGKYDDDTCGSPIIAIDCMSAARKASKHDTEINLFFGELKKARYAKLEKNLEKYIAEDTYCKNHVKYQQIQYRDLVLGISKTINQATVFYYLDPFGIVDMDFGIFDEIRSQAGNESVEILLNFCSPGFIREACWIFGAEKDSRLLEVMGDLAEEEFDPNSSSIEREKRLCEIAHGDWWKPLIKRFKEKPTMSFWNLEEEITTEYCMQLRNLFTYVLEMPIKTDSKKPAVKYRMVFMSNHHKGCLLMNDTMIKAYKDVAGETLFNMPASGPIVSEEMIERTMREQVMNLSTVDYFSVDEFISELIAKIGVVYRSGELKKQFLTPLSENGEGFIERRPKFTKVTKKPSDSWKDREIRRVAKD